MQQTKSVPKDDVWVSTTCDMCNDVCGMLAHRVDGVVVDIKGDPRSAYSRGKLCARAYAVLMGLYDPYRVKYPLKRTNPEKGLGVDPGWVRISWEEALDILQRELSKVRDDPRRLTTVDYDSKHMLYDYASRWTQAFSLSARKTTGLDSMHTTGFGNYFCGQYYHPMAHLAHGTWRTETDPDYCNYHIMWGQNWGFGTGHHPNEVAQHTAEARKRGMKVVVVDPLCNNAGSKADDWLPLRPGTDGALVLSMINVLLNEVGIYDREFIKRHTNGPYLVKPDGTYLRREGKPLVWDATEQIAKTYDDEVKDYAIEAPGGRLLVDGVECSPAFHLLKEHVKKYTPEMASEITTIPAATIRRIAEEFGRAAQVGSTIMIEGKELPLRPAASTQFRGSGSHRSGYHFGLANFILNQIVGSYFVPGGLQGMHLVGREVGREWSWQPTATKETDGLMQPHPGEPHEDVYNFDVKAPKTYNLSELYPLGAPTAVIENFLHPEKYGLPEPGVFLAIRSNRFLSGVNHKITAEAMKKFGFIAAFRCHLDEMTELADLVLPDINSLEECDCGTMILGAVEAGGQRALPQSSPMCGHWFWAARRGVVPPVGEARHYIDVLMELAERMGFLGDVYRVMNDRLSEAPYFVEGMRLDPSKKYSPAEIYDRQCKSMFGEDHGLDWFEENGWLNIKMTVEEKYPLPWLSKIRWPIYFENILRAGKEVKKVANELGLKDWDVTDYEALPNWRPCPAYKPAGEFDLIAINFRVPTHSFSWTAENAWLSELAELNPYAQRVIINTQTAKRKGIKDKDRVIVESRVGKVSGVAKVTECVHPETVAISGHFGSLSKGTPVAYGKGANFNNLLPHDQYQMLSPGIDACVRVKVYKA